MPELIIGLLLGLAAGLLAGWDGAVHYYRWNRRKLIAIIEDLEERVTLFQTEAEDDPQRAWLNMGQRSVLNQIDTTIRTIRSNLERP